MIRQSTIRKILTNGKMFFASSITYQHDTDEDLYNIVRVEYTKPTREIFSMWPVFVAAMKRINNAVKNDIEGCSKPVLLSLLEWDILPSGNLKTLDMSFTDDKITLDITFDDEFYSQIGAIPPIWDSIA